MLHPGQLNERLEPAIGGIRAVPQFFVADLRKEFTETSIEFALNQVAPIATNPMRLCEIVIYPKQKIKKTANIRDFFRAAKIYKKESF